MKKEKAQTCAVENIAASNAIYCDCCYKMGRRFERLGQKYRSEGRLEFAAQMESEAVIQLTAWRKAKAERDSIAAGPLKIAS